MRYEYVVTLRRNVERQIDVISLGLCSLSVLAFIFAQFRSGKFSILLCFGSIIVTIGIIQNLVQSRQQRIRYKIPLLLSGLFWIGMPWLNWFSVIFFLLAFLEYQAKYPLEIGFSTDRIVINTLFPRRYSWSDMNQVILKDGLLTMDFKNNLLLQKETIDEDEDADADEDEFNDYCIVQLRKVNGL
ncbi:MAG: hypothetical protein ACHQET_06360 [Chitinophagales bacterium]